MHCSTIFWLSIKYSEKLSFIVVSPYCSYQQEANKWWSKMH
jgi:flagellar assembly factor FliW